MLLILEGNISAGKSTLSRELGPLLGCKVFMEPTVTNPYLELFYADPPKWALKMQLWLLRQRYRMYIEALRHIYETGEGVILDRSVFSDAVFADQGLIDKVISPEGYAYYLELRTQMLRCLPVPHVTLYLAVTPEECQRRIRHERCRECESGIPLEYLAGLDSCYQKFLGDMAAFGSAVVVENWESYGNSKEIAARVASSVASRAVRTPDGTPIDTAWLGDFIYDPVAVRAAMVLPHTVDGIDDSDPLPEDVDFERLNQLEEEAAQSESSSPQQLSPQRDSLPARDQSSGRRAPARAKLFNDDAPTAVLAVGL
eukprot:Amastigsp_a7027_21.p2 type:complete len:313 gc:universal Amastigsp_a7027_21:1040-102(-)